MVTRGGAGVGNFVGDRVMVGGRDGVGVWVKVGNGVLVTGFSATRVTTNVSTLVTSRVTSIVWITGIDFGDATGGVQETPEKMSRHTARDGTKYFKIVTPKEISP
jgi:hypothetical protein